MPEKKLTSEQVDQLNANAAQMQEQGYSVDEIKSMASQYFNKFASEEGEPVNFTPASSEQSEGQSEEQKTGGETQQFNVPRPEEVIANQRRSKINGTPTTKEDSSQQSEKEPLTWNNFNPSTSKGEVKKIEPVEVDVTKFNKSKEQKAQDFRKAVSSFGGIKKDPTQVANYKKEVNKTREAEPTYRPSTKEKKVLIEQKENSPSYIDNVTDSIGKTYDNVTNTIGDLAVNAPSYLNRKAIQMGIVEADLVDDVEFKQVSVQENKATNLKSEGENVVKTDVPNIITGGTKDHIVQDKHWKTLNNPASAPLSSHRNQFNAEEGFIYNTIPAKGNTNAPEELPENLGIAHFFIMDAINDGSRKEGQKDVYSATNEELRTQSNLYKNGRDYRRKKEDEYIPVFTKINKNKIPYNYDKEGVHKLKVQYKKKKGITKEDNVVQNLVQYKLSDIDWDNEVKDVDIKGRSKQYSDDIKVIATKDGIPIPSLPVYVGGDKNRKRYGRFAGAGVVFLFEKDKVIYADDYSGSINNIKKEIQRLKDDYKLTDDELTLGFYDAGSYTAKPAADPKTGIINRNQFSDFNNKEESGSGIAIPKQ